MFDIRLSRLWRRSLVDWKSVVMCEMESRVCEGVMAEFDGEVEPEICLRRRSNVRSAASAPSRRWVMCFETLCRPAKSILPAIEPRVAWLSTCCGRTVQSKTVYEGARIVKESMEWTYGFHIAKYLPKSPCCFV